MELEPRNSAPGYYGLPVLKRPHWGWEIALYFWTGGVAAGAYIVAAIADIFGDDDDRAIVRAGRLIALPLMIVSPLLLVKDLGRPERFLNMLRVVKLRSPMSAGAWGVLFFGGFTGLSALLELWTPDDGMRRLRRIVAVAGAPWGFFVGGYTGVLLAATAIPLWWRNRLLWGPTFLASALATGSAAIQLALALRWRPAGQAMERLERVHLIGVATEGALLAVGLLHLGSAGRLLTRGRWSTLFVPGALGLGVALPLLLGVRAAGRSRMLISAVATLVGGLVLRVCVVYGGRNSADDAQAYFEATGTPRAR